MEQQRIEVPEKSQRLYSELVAKAQDAHRNAATGLAMLRLSLEVPDGWTFDGVAFEPEASD